MLFKTFMAVNLLCCLLTSFSREELSNDFNDSMKNIKSFYVFPFAIIVYCFVNRHNLKFIRFLMLMKNHLYKN